jgi:hypothetical protein
MEMAVGVLVFAFAGVVILSLLASWIWMAVVAFQTHPAWGVAVLCCHPWASLVFAFTNWQRAKRPALLTIAGLVGMVVLAISIPLLKSAGLVKRQPQPAPSPSASPAF